MSESRAMSSGTVVFIGIIMALVASSAFFTSQFHYYSDSQDISPIVVIFMIVIVIGFIGVYFYNPWIAMMFIFITRPLVEQFWFISENFLQIYGAASILLLLVHLFLNMPMIQKSNTFILLSLLFIGSITIGIFNGINLKWGIYEGSRQLLPILIGIAIFWGLDRKERLDTMFKYIFRVVLPVLVFPSFIMMIYFASTGELGGYLEKDWVAIEGAFKNSHNLAHWMCFAMAVSVLYYYYAQKKSDRVLAVVLFICSFILNLIGARRTTLVGFGIFFVIFYWLTNRRRMLVAGLIAMLIPVLTFQYSSGRIEGLKPTEDAEGKLDDSYGSGRIGLWRASLPIFWASPFYEYVYGCGWGAEQKLVPYAGPERGFSIHNDYLFLLFSIGFVGVILYIFIQCYGFWVAWQVYIQSRGGFYRDFSAFIISFSAMVCATNFASNSYVSRIGPHIEYFGFLAAIVAIYKTLIPQSESALANNEIAKKAEKAETTAVAIPLVPSFGNPMPIRTTMVPKDKAPVSDLDTIRYICS